MTNGKYNIEVRFEGGLTTAQEAAFTSAGDRWSQLISADVPSVRLPNGEVSTTYSFLLVGQDSMDLPAS